MSNVEAKLIGMSYRSADLCHKRRYLIVRFSPATTTAMGTPMLIVENGCRIVDNRETVYAWAYANFDSLKDGETVSEASVLKYARPVPPFPYGEYVPDRRGGA